MALIRGRVAGMFREPRKRTRPLFNSPRAANSSHASVRTTVGVVRWFTQINSGVSHELTQQPATDPTQIYRYRDGLYAQDMLIVGIVWLDLFTWLANNPSTTEDIEHHFQLTPRPADVMLTLFVAMGLLERRGGIYHVTAITREHLCADSPCFLGPYYASLKERPVCKD